MSDKCSTEDGWLMRANGQRFFLIVLGFNDTSTLVGHFVSSHREREKRDSKGDDWEGQGERKMNKSEGTEDIPPPYPYLLQGQQALPNCKPISVGRPTDVRYTPPSHHPTTPPAMDKEQQLKKWRCFSYFSLKTGLEIPFYTICIKCQNCFLGNIRKIFQIVVCWKFYPKY